MYPFIWFSPDKCLRVGLLDHMVASFLVFKGNSIPFSIVAVSFYIPTHNIRRFPFLYTLWHLSFADFDDGHSDWCEVIPHCSFDVHFSTNY